MKITLVVLFLAGLTIYCKCAAVLFLPPSLIPYAAFLDETLTTEEPLVVKDNELQQQLLAAEDEEESNEPALAADLYTNFKNLWHNDLSLNLQKREQRNVFDDDIKNFASMQQRQQQLQQAMATIKRNNQNRNGPRLHDDDNVGHKNYNHNNNNKNENNILKSASTPLPLSLSSAAATDMNEATNLNLNMQPQLQLPLEKAYDVANEWLSSSSPAMIDDIFVSPPHQIPEPLRPKRGELENMPPLAVAATATEDSPFLNRFLKSTKYWPRQCPLENENNCQREYYGALVADRKNALWQQLQDRQNNLFPGAEKYSSLNQNNDINDDDVVLLLTAEQNLMKFLSWALSALYPYGKFPNLTDNAADSYHPGMYMWKKLNLSGQLEPPLLVDEPKYVIVRREYDSYEDDDIDIKRGLNYDQDPFIPPRGRKHNLPDLDSLLQRYETFVPNRGRRDKLKDSFKYDDFFYPNRGKRQMTTAAYDKGVTHERSDDTDIHDTKENQSYCNNEENAVRFAMQYPSLLNELMEYRENLMTKMKRKLHQSKQKVANIFDEIMANRNEPTRRMSTSFQQASPAATVATVSATAPTSVLKKSLKSMINILHNRKNHIIDIHQIKQMPDANRGKDMRQMNCLLHKH